MTDTQQQEDWFTPYMVSCLCSEDFLFCSEARQPITATHGRDARYMSVVPYKDGDADCCLFFVTFLARVRGPLLVVFASADGFFIDRLFFTCTQKKEEK